MMTTGQTFDPRGSFGGNRSVLLLRWNGRPGSTESVWMQCSEESTSSQLTKQLSLQVCQDTFLQRVSSTVFCLRVHLYMPTNFDHPVRPPEPISTNRLNCHSTCHCSHYKSFLPFVIFFFPCVCPTWCTYYAYCRSSDTN